MTAAIVGASGFAGAELVRLLAQHPEIELAFQGASSKAGAAVASVYPQLPGDTYGSVDDVPDAGVVFLALPHTQSMSVGPALAAGGATVIDLGADFRLDEPNRFEAAYGVPHTAPDQLGSWPYGLPELFRHELIGARTIASPGCYPTATALALAPLLREGVIDTAGIVVDAKSGVTGAGRNVGPDHQFALVNEDVAAYKVARHQHRPEIEMSLEKVAGTQVSVTFTPHLVPMNRGLLATCYGRQLRDDVDLDALYADFYTGEPCVRAVDRPPHTSWATGSNLAFVHATADPQTGIVVALGALDNLGKGAAGQAIQNANIALGLPETLGLPLAGMPV